MPVFSEESKSKLKNANSDLQLLFNEVIKYWDCKILETYRSPEEQFILFKQGRILRDKEWVIVDKRHVVTNCDGFIKISNHNVLPSNAIDVMPYPIDWSDDYSFAYFAGKVMEINRRMVENGIIKSHIRWGGDWNENNRMKDERLIDFPHFEII